MNNWQVVRITDDLARFEAQAKWHKQRLNANVAKVRGQTVRVHFDSKANEHTYWQVHPDDVERLTPDRLSRYALVCSCIVEAD